LVVGRPIKRDCDVTGASFAKIVARGDCPHEFAVADCVHVSEPLPISLLAFLPAGVLTWEDGLGKKHNRQEDPTARSDRKKRKEMHAED
jgi:hypothetical protein